MFAQNYGAYQHWVDALVSDCKETVVSYMCFQRKVAPEGLTAAWGTLIMVKACVRKKLHTENEVFLIMGGIIDWCS